MQLTGAHAGPVKHALSERWGLRLVQDPALRTFRNVGNGRSLADGCFVEVTVDGGAGNGEQVGDLLDCVSAGVVEPLGVKGLRWCEFRSASTDPAAGSGGSETVACVGDDEFALQLVQDGEHAEHGPAFGGGGVDALFQDAQADVALAERGAEGD